MANVAEIFRINQKIELSIANTTEYFSSRVEDLVNNDLVVAMPMRNSIPVYLPLNEKVFGRVFVSDGVLYSFDSSLLKYVMNPVPIWVISTPTNIKKIQLRNFFRHNIRLPIKYIVLNKDNMPIESTQTVVMTKNLSAGGALITLANKDELPIDTTIWLEILLGKEVIRALAKVRRKPIEETADGKKLYLAGIEFMDMEEQIKKKIISFLNLKMLDNRNRGVL